MQVSLNRPVGLMAAPRFGKLSKPVAPSASDRVIAILKETIGLKILPNPDSLMMCESMRRATLIPLPDYFQAVEAALTALDKEGFTLAPTKDINKSKKNFGSEKAFEAFKEIMGRFMGAMECRMEKADKAEIQKFYDDIQASRFDYTPLVFNRFSYGKSFKKTQPWAKWFTQHGIRL